VGTKSQVGLCWQLAAVSSQLLATPAVTRGSSLWLCGYPISLGFGFTSYKDMRLAIPSCAPLLGAGCPFYEHRLRTQLDQVLTEKQRRCEGGTECFSPPPIPCIPYIYTVPSPKQSTARRWYRRRPQVCGRQHQAGCAQSVTPLGHQRAEAPLRESART
jgi:hypothetical protein